MNILQVVRCVFKLNSSLPLQNDISLKAAQISFAHKLYNECIYEIKERMLISCKIYVMHNDICLNKRGTLAEVHLPEKIPLYGTPAFKNYGVKMIVSLHVRNFDDITYIRCIAHEMSHIILDSLRSEYRNSEIATDITTMILGFSQVVKSSRFNCGYINGKNFWTTYYLIKLLQFKKNILASLKKQYRQLQSKIISV